MSKYYEVRFYTKKGGEQSWIIHVEAKTAKEAKEIDMKKATNGHITECYIYMNAHYFTRRECISFNRDGWIGFAGWADDGNTNPLRRAFLAWCDYLAEGGEADGKAD